MFSASSDPPMVPFVIYESERQRAVTLHRVHIFDLAGVPQYRCMNGTIHHRLK
jgi:hypothetical protein